MTDNSKNWPSCPIPQSEYATITMAHGGGGKMMHQLIEKIYKQAFRDVALQADHDGAILSMPTNKLAFTTDSYVVNPLFFPGGDIGKLAIYGTVNDLAMCGARPLYLSVGFILEEGLPIDMLWQVVVSMSRAAAESGINIVTGDTKVVDKGKGDGIYINTAGVGVIEHELTIAPKSIRPGDAIILSGDIGRHGIAVIAGREGLQFETTIESDCAPLAKSVARLLESGVEIHCLRDLTRGGLISALVEIAGVASTKITIEESAIPVRNEVRAACELLGFDPLYVANEGRFIAIVPDNQKDKALAVLRSEAVSADSRVIGMVIHSSEGRVTMTTPLGVERIVYMIIGEQLPRIC
jgi:hydrogenase expression/formation protein HypE